MPPRRRAPTLGEHTEEILGGELGMTGREIAEAQQSRGVEAGR